jgi:putative ABC transport system permease protein
MEQVLSTSLKRPRFTVVLPGVFASVGLLLAVVGIYGVISYLVGQRTHEIGVRIALGARAGDILGMILAQGAWLALVGIALGLGAALAAARFVENLLFNLPATDPLTFAGISLLLGAVALLACYVPARRATRVDPMVALRHE